MSVNFSDLVTGDSILTLDGRFLLVAWVDVALGRIGVEMGGDAPRIFTGCQDRVFQVA